MEINIISVEESKLDYSKSLEELTAFFDANANNPEYRCGEFMMLGYAIDFVGLMGKIANVKLDLSEGSIAILDQLLIALSDGVKKGVFNQTAFEGQLKGATGLFSLIVWKNLGGSFINSNVGYGVSVNGTNAFVLNRVGRRLQGDATSDLVSLYVALKNAKENK